ncbi:MAG: TetR/AcrR family transcriptional regulator [Halobacteriota archaeon]
MPRVVLEYKQEARNRIVRVAQDAFAEKGYDQTTMEYIGNRLGVSKGALYLYFKSKEELFETICETRQRTLRQILRASLKEGDLIESSLDFFDAITARHSEYPIGLTFELISEAARNEKLKTILREDYDQRLEILTGFLQEQRSNGLLRDNIDVPFLSANLSALFNGLIIALILGKEVEEVKRTWIDAIRGVLVAVGDSVR